MNKEKVEKLYNTLKDILERRYNGKYEFNKDKNLVFDLLEGLLINKERYGYMACPCRLACGDREKDKDIICPCEYRDKDIEEFGKCYCGLYVSKEYNLGLIQDICVPERRKNNLF